jgi:DNA invertase Pin-like site-specific DNA recombinase
VSADDNFLEEHAADVVNEVKSVISRLLAENKQLREKVAEYRQAHSGTVFAIGQALQGKSAMYNRKKLSPNDARHIRELHSSGFKQSEIARAYDVNPTTVSRIVRGVYYA